MSKLPLSTGDNYHFRAHEAELDVGLGLALEDRAALSTLINLMARRKGLVLDAPKQVAAQVGCSVQRWVAIRRRLVAAQVLASVVTADGRVWIDLGPALEEQRDLLRRLPGAPRQKVGPFIRG